MMITPYSNALSVNSLNNTVKKFFTAKNLMYATSITTGAIGITSLLAAYCITRNLKTIPDKVFEELAATPKDESDPAERLVVAFCAPPIILAVGLGLSTFALGISTLALPTSIITGYAAYKMKQ